MPTRDPKIRAAIEAHTRALEARILAERLKAAGADGAHQALVDGNRARSERIAVKVRACGWKWLEA